jgi:hypothetical protein
MPLQYGSKPPVEASGGDLTISVTGMSKEIFDTMDDLLAPPLEQAVREADEDGQPGAEEALKQARHGWQKLAYAVAKGVVDHLKTHMEIHDVETSIRASEDVSGATGRATATGSGHSHPIDLDDMLDGVRFDQRPNTGRVE